MSLTNKLLEVINLSKSYYQKDEEIKVLNNVSFDLNEKDFLAIIGPSGCGKSSILNIISGLDKEYTGNVIVKDNIKIGYMLQNDALFDHLNVFDNATLGLKISNQLNSVTIKHVNDLLKKYGLNDFINKYPNELSGGMRQRVALIRTLAMNPDILLLDEPFSSLDAQTRLSVCEDVFNIIKSENKTIIIVTHDISEALSVANKIIVLSKRPAYVKDIYNINLSNSSSSIKNRNDEKFYYYFNKIWEDIDK